MKVDPEALKALRLARGETQVGLAARAGLTEQTLNYAERGRKQPRLGTLRKLSAALNVPISDFAIAENAAEAKAFDDLKVAS